MNTRLKVLMNQFKSIMERAFKFIITIISVMVLIFIAVIFVGTAVSVDQELWIMCRSALLMIMLCIVLAWSASNEQ